MQNKLNMRKKVGVKADSVDIAKAKSLKTSPEELAELSKNKDREVRIWVANNVNTPPETLAELAKDKSLKTSPEELAELSKNKDREVRIWVADNPNTSPEILAELAKDKYKDVRQYVAYNKNTLPETLAELAKDKDQGVRQFVADNLSTSPETLAELAKDKDEEVRENAIENPSYVSEYSVEKELKYYTTDPKTVSNIQRFLSNFNQEDNRFVNEFKSLLEQQGYTTKGQLTKLLKQLNAWSQDVENIINQIIKEGKSNLFLRSVYSQEEQLSSEQINKIFERLTEFTQTFERYKGKMKPFPHKVRFLVGPEFYIDQVITSLPEGVTLEQLDEVNYHRKGVIAWALVKSFEVEDNIIWVITEIQSDIIQRSMELPDEIRSRVENYFRDWYKLLWNTVLTESRENNVKEVWITSSETLTERWHEDIRHGEEALTSLFQRIYDIPAEQYGAESHKILKKDIPSEMKDLTQGSYWIIQVAEIDPVKLAKRAQNLEYWKTYALNYLQTFVKEMKRSREQEFEDTMLSEEEEKWFLQEAWEHLMEQLPAEMKEPEKLKELQDFISSQGLQIKVEETAPEVEELILEPGPLSTETIEASPYAELLRKYTEDEIFDIASGRKEAIEEEVEQAKEVISRGIVSNRLNMRKKAQSTPETIQKAQTGDENAIAQVIEENIGLISQALIKWGYTPKSDEFEDVMSDIKVEMLNRVIPQYDPSKGAFSTFLSTAVYNFLRRGTREKEYKEKQKEVSLAEPVEEGITIEDTLADKTSEVVQMTLSSARENLQNWLHMNKPELEEVVLRVFDLKVEEYSHERIAEALNQEEYTSKGKAFTRTMVNNYVNDWIKPALAQFFEAFKTAKLNMRKKAQVNLDNVAREYFDWLKKEKVEEGLTYDQDEIVTNIYEHIGLESDYDLSSSELDYITNKVIEMYEQEFGKFEGTGLKVKVDRELTEETMEASPYAELLRKYTADEIYDIAAGKKEATEEEVEQAKEVITRGIVAGKLSMRKKAQEQRLSYEELLQKYKKGEKFTEKRAFEYCRDVGMDVKKVGSGKYLRTPGILDHGDSEIFSVKQLREYAEKDWDDLYWDLTHSETSEKQEELTEETMEASPYAELLNKYSPDEIFDIAAGKKDATEEEVEQAKEVITRGIVANRLSMRKKAQKVTKQELIHLYKQEAKSIYDEELMDEIISGFIVSLNNKYKKIVKRRGEQDPQCEEIFEMIENLERAKTPQEKMIAIDRELSVAHFEGFYVADLIEGGTEKFLDELHDIAEPKSVPNKLQIAGTSTSVKLLIEFAKDPDEKIRSAVAANLNTPPETLAELAKDEDEGVRFWVAANLNTPPETLAELAKDEDEGVRFSAVTNPNIPSEAIEKSQSLFGGLNMRKKGN